MVSRTSTEEHSSNRQSSLTCSCLSAYAVAIVVAQRGAKQAHGKSPSHLLIALMCLAISNPPIDQPLDEQLVELKNGSTFNGHLVACDNFMNLTLREVYETSASGEQFWKQKECYIRGSTVSSLPLFFLSLLNI